MMSSELHSWSFNYYFRPNINKYAVIVTTNDNEEMLIGYCNNVQECDNMRQYYLENDVEVEPY